MGSSGAAVAGGVMLAAGLLSHQNFSEQQLLEFATKMEGHPDNVAPALFGGLTIAWVDEAGPHHKKLTVHRGISPLVLVAPNEMSTKLARSLQAREELSGLEILRRLFFVCGLAVQLRTISKTTRLRSGPVGFSARASYR